MRWFQVLKYANVMLYYRCCCTKQDIWICHLGLSKVHYFLTFH